MTGRDRDQLTRAVFTVQFGGPGRRLAILTDPTQRALEGQVVVRCGRCAQRRELVRAWGMPGSGRPLVIGQYEVSAPLMMRGVGTSLYGVKLVCHPKCGAVYPIPSERFDVAFAHAVATLDELVAATRDEPRTLSRDLVLPSGMAVAAGVEVARCTSHVPLRPVPADRANEAGPFRGPRAYPEQHPGRVTNRRG